MKAKDLMLAKQSILNDSHQIMFLILIQQQKEKLFLLLMKKI